MILDQAKNIAIGVAVGLAVGFAAGYYTESRFFKADEIDAASKAQHQTATGIQQSLSTSLEVDAKVAASNQSVTGIRQEVATHLATKEIVKHEANAAPDSRPVPSCDWSLDNGTLGLLNAAREGATASPTSFSDAESEAPSGVGEAQLIDNDLQVVEQYHELATRHDALVDYVQSIINKQTGQ